MIKFRYFLVSVAVIVAGGQPIYAQSAADPIEKRVRKLEGEMKAVQRKVFPGGDSRYFEPEIAPATAPSATAPGVPATSPVSDLAARVDALERQLQSLTAQSEQNGFRLRQLEEALGKFRNDAEFRLNTLEGNPTGTPTTQPGGASGAPAALSPAKPAAAAAATASPVQTAAPEKPAGDPVEAEWNAAYAHVKASDWAKAEPALQAIITKYPKHNRAASALFWQGRTFYAQAKYAQAAKSFLESYNKFPKALRGPDSLLWVGKSLIKFAPPRPDKACEAYAEMQSVYGASLSESLKSQLAKARTDAKCS